MTGRSISESISASTASNYSAGSEEWNQDKVHILANTAIGNMCSQSAEMSTLADKQRVCIERAYHEKAPHIHLQGGQMVKLKTISISSIQQMTDESGNVPVRRSHAKIT